MDPHLIWSLQVSSDHGGGERKTLKTNRDTAQPPSTVHRGLPPPPSYTSSTMPHRPVCHPSIIMRSESNVLQYE